MDDDAGEVTEDLINLMRLVRFGIPYREAARLAPARRKACCRAIDRLDGPRGSAAQSSAEGQEVTRMELEAFVERAKELKRERAQLVAEIETMLDEARRSGFNLHYFERFGISAERLHAYKEWSGPPEPLAARSGDPSGT